MPIDIDRFEERSEEDLRAGGETNAEKLLRFLGSHPDRAFTPREIHEATDVPRGSVGVVLSRLEEQALVRHRGDYWAIEDRDDLDTTLTSLATARAATEQLGPEDPDEWGAGVDEEDE